MHLPALRQGYLSTLKADGQRVFVMLFLPDEGPVGLVVVDRTMKHRVLVPCVRPPKAMMVLDAEEVLVTHSGANPDSREEPAHRVLLAFDVLIDSGPVAGPGTSRLRGRASSLPGQFPGRSLQTESVVYNSMVERLKVLERALAKLSRFPGVCSVGVRGEPEWLAAVIGDLAPVTPSLRKGMFPAFTQLRNLALAVGPTGPDQVGLVFKPYVPVHSLPLLPETGTGAWTWECVEGTHRTAAGLLCDGLVMYRALSTYHPQNKCHNPRGPECLKFKPAHLHSIDFLVVLCAEETQLRRMYPRAPLFGPSLIFREIETIAEKEVSGAETVNNVRHVEENRVFARAYRQLLLDLPWPDLTSATSSSDGLFLFVPDASPGIGLPFARVTEAHLSRVSGWAERLAALKADRAWRYSPVSVGVFECCFSQWRKVWMPKHFRPDKKRGNAIETVIKTAENVFNPVSRERLIQECRFAC